jgi:serine/threonine protein kinase
MNQIKFRQTYIVTDEQLQNQPQRVLKHLKPRNCNEPVVRQAITCFDAEIEKLKKLDSSQCKIPQIIESFQDEQEFYIVYEYIDGENLSEQITDNNRWNQEQVIDLLQQVLEILKYLHQEGVQHLNIKPANLVKRSDGKIFLIDFGGVNEISTLAFNDQTQIVSKQPVGTKGYMPPEQENGLPLHSNCDLYALGMTAIQALTGISPDKIERNPQTNKIVWTNEIQVNHKLRQILDKMVNTEFRERYKSADEVLQDLSQIEEETQDFSQIEKTKNWNLITSMLQDKNVKKIWFVLPSVVIVIIFLIVNYIIGNQNNANNPNYVDPNPKNLPPSSLDGALNNVDIRIGGSNSMAKIKESLKESFETKYKNSRIISVPEASGKGINAVEKGEADIAASSRPLTAKEQNENHLVSVPITEDSIVFVTGRNNNPYHNGFTQEQIRKILTCQITNWSSVGGENKTIKLFIKPLNSGTSESVKSLVLNGQDFCKEPHIKILEKDSDVELLIPELKTDGIGYGSSLNLAGQQNVTIQRIDGHKWNHPDYPYKRQLFFVYKYPPSPKVEAFMKYLETPEAKQAIHNVTNITEP